MRMCPHLNAKRPALQMVSSAYPSVSKIRLTLSAISIKHSTNGGLHKMENKTQITVLKFGSSVLRSEKDLPSAVHEIYRHWRDGAQVIAVVSAFGDTTDQLMRRAESICGQREKSALASLLATGETTSSALLS